MNIEQTALIKEIKLINNLTESNAVIERDSRKYLNFMA